MLQKVWTPRDFKIVTDFWGAPCTYFTAPNQPVVGRRRLHGLALHPSARPVLRGRVTVFASVVALLRPTYLRLKQRTAVFAFVIGPTIAFFFVFVISLNAQCTLCNN